METGFIQVIVTTFGEGKQKRRGLTEGLREFTEIDNERALEDGHLDQCMGKFGVRRPKVPEACPDVTERESPDELTLSAEEVGAVKTNINVHNIEEERWGPPSVDYDWYAFCLALYKGIEGEDWRDM